MVDKIPGKEEKDKASDAKSTVAEQARDAFATQFSKPPESATSSTAGVHADSTQAAGKSSSNKLPAIKIEDNPSGQTAPKTPEERQAAEHTYFQYLFEKKNLLLDPFQKGEGPEQVLHRMNDNEKLGQTHWSDEHIHEEAERISRRDLRGEKHSYHIDEQTPLWSAKEISKQVKETVDRVKGIDVSHFDGDINWKEVKASGIDFAFLKSTGANRDGSVAVDSTFEKNRTDATKAGVAIGFYHFFRPDVPLDKQVELFAKTVGKLERNNLPVVMDVEEDEKKPMWKASPDGHEYTPQERVKIIDDFCNGVEKALGKHTPIAIYTSPNFVRDYLDNDKSLSKYQLWDASWKVPQPSTPQPWSKATFWQYAGDSGKVAGINNPDGVDLDMAMDPNFLRPPFKHKK